jgi:hypothetical protein
MEAVEMSRIEGLDDIRGEIAKRWSIPRWDRLFPWWPRPVTVKLLFYADGSIQFDGGPFLGLNHVLATLTANPFHWVRFEVTTVHRFTDPSADHSGLDLAEALGIDDFDEVWIYTIQRSPVLTATELRTAERFMAGHRGGVLLTGDSAGLGGAFGNLPRAGKMRGDIAPAPAPATEWPGGVGAEVVARTAFVGSDGAVDREAGAVSIYDGHRASVGRVVADPRWHDHFDLELDGDPGRLEHFVLSSAIWLAPAAKQVSMRFAAWWPSLWSADLIRRGPDGPLLPLGRAARAALARHAPRCAVLGWIWDLVPAAVHRSLQDLLDLPGPPLPVTEYLVGAAARELMTRFDIGPDSALPSQPPSEEAFNRVLTGAVRLALDSMADDALTRARALRDLARVAVATPTSENLGRLDIPSRDQSSKISVAWDDDRRGP